MSRISDLPPSRSPGLSRLRSRYPGSWISLRYPNLRIQDLRSRAHSPDPKSCFGAAADLESRKWTRVPPFNNEYDGNQNADIQDIKINLSVTRYGKDVNKPVCKSFIASYRNFVLVWGSGGAAPGGFFSADLGSCFAGPSGSRI